MVLILIFRYQCFHVCELFLDLGQHLLTDLELDSTGMVLDRQGILRKELNQHVVFRFILLLAHLDDHEFLLLFVAGLFLRLVAVHLSTTAVIDTILWRLKRMISALQLTLLPFLVLDTIWTKQLIRIVMIRRLAVYAIFNSSI